MAQHNDKSDAEPQGAPTPDTRPVPEPDSKAGFDQEVGDLDEADTPDDEDTLPGRVGGGLAGA